MWERGKGEHRTSNAEHRITDYGSVGLRSYQRAVFEDHTSGIVVLHWSRQIGKSFVLAAWAVIRLLSRPGRLVTVLSNSRENGAEFLAKCAEICSRNSTKFETVVRSHPKLEFEDMRMELRIPYAGKVGRIKVLAANPRTARGFSGDLILDEFAFHEDGKAVWAAAEPILASNRDFLCRIASTGNGRHNMFYRMTGDASAECGMRSAELGKGKEECPKSKVQGPKSGNIDPPSLATARQDAEHGTSVAENPTWSRIAEVVPGSIVDGLPYIPGSWSKEQVQSFVLKPDAARNKAADQISLATDSHGCTQMGTECPKSDVQGPKLEEFGQGVDEVKSLLSPALSSPECEEREKSLDALAGAETSQSAGLVRVATDIGMSGQAAPGDGRTPGEGEGNIQDPMSENIEHPTPNTEHRMENGEAPLPGPLPTPSSRGEGEDIGDGKESRTRTNLLAQGHPKGWTPNGECPPSHVGGYVEGQQPYYFVSKSGFKVSRVTRSMAHGMGVEIYDSQTREAITPEQARAQALDKRAYDQNYECSFTDENLALLTHELISAAESDDEAAKICEQDWTKEALEVMRVANNPLYAGLDVGRKVDMSVLTVLERVGRVYHVRGMLRMRNMRLPDQEERLQQLRRCRQLKQVCIDMTGLGLGLFEYAQRTMGEHMVSGINFSSSVSATRVIREEGTNREKVRVTEAMAMEVLRVYEDRRMRQPRDWELREDLRKPEKVTSPSGKVSIAAVRDGAGHADHFWSLALALEAAGGSEVPFAYQAIPRRKTGLLI